ncbi:hypothetical protein EDC56_2353 [Sinobacterium caligoides]|uniref:Spore coat protein U-like protein n=1 Tax=Sinobacterium caligoides TaxID=933926 RepID=A0A3N2DPZ7_9GAMM|nr:hypothetical protein [Sinobacterium caligoides]ROS01904.1 hypothetical protein EDC56_2353 [Sinobacterium caligoides]
MTQKDVLRCLLICGLSLQSAQVFAEIRFEQLPSAIRLSAWEDTSLNSDIIGQEQFCLISKDDRWWSTNADYTLNAVMSGNMLGGSFFLYNGDDRLPFKLYFNRNPGSNSFVQLNYAQDSSRFQEAENCSVGQVELRVGIAQSDIASVSAGLYTGTLTLEATNYFLWFANPPVSINLSIEIPKLVQISGLQDMTLSPAGGTMLADQQDFCVYATGANNFSITASSQQNGFKLLRSGQASCGAGNCLPYRVQVSRQDGSQSEQLTDGLVSSQRWRGETSKLCQQGNNMHLLVSADVLDASAGNYTDTLTLTVRPD